MSHKGLVQRDGACWLRVVWFRDDDCRIRVWWCRDDARRIRVWRLNHSDVRRVSLCRVWGRRAAGLLSLAPRRRAEREPMAVRAERRGDPVGHPLEQVVRPGGGRDDDVRVA